MIQWKKKTTVKKSNLMNRRKRQIDTSNTHIHDHTLFYLGVGISPNGGGVKLALWAFLSE